MAGFKGKVDGNYFQVGQILFPKGVLSSRFPHLLNFFIRNLAVVVFYGPGL